VTLGDEEPKQEAASERNMFADKRIVIGGGALLVAVIGFGLFLGGKNDGAGTTTTTSALTSQTTSSIVEAATPTTASPGGGTSDLSTPTTTAAPVDVNPLTGEALGAANTGQVIAVKIDNAPAAQGQIGLREAGIVFEVPVEGGLTRFTALYFDNVPVGVGPARSIRPVDGDLLAPFNPVVVTTGGRPWVVREVEAAGAIVLTDDTFFEEILRQPPSNLLALAAKANAGATGGPPSTPPFRFGDGFSGSPVSSVNIPLSGVMDVTWAVGGDGWERSQNGAPFQIADLFDSDPTDYSVDTLVIMMVAERSAGYQDTAGATVPTFDVIGFGKVMVFSDGEVVEGEWRRGSQKDGWILISDTGEEILLPRGRVFVEVVPRYVDVTLN
jgi:DUF3048 family protein